VGEGDVWPTSGLLLTKEIRDRPGGETPLNDATVQQLAGYEFADQDPTEIAGGVHDAADEKTALATDFDLEPGLRRPAGVARALALGDEAFVATLEDLLPRLHAVAIEPARRKDHRPIVDLALERRSAIAEPERPFVKARFRNPVALTLGRRRAYSLGHS